MVNLLKYPKSYPFKALIRSANITLLVDPDDEYSWFDFATPFNFWRAYDGVF